MTIAAEYEGESSAAADASRTGGIRPEDLRRVVSIHYYGRSGSLFLQSLLDGHPQVVMLPGTYLAGFYRFWETFGQLPALKLLGAFITNYDVLFDARSPVPVFEVGRDVGITLGFDRMGEDQDRTLGVDRNEFMESLLAHVIRVCDDPNVERLSRRFFLQAIHAAYAQALGQPKSKDMLIVLQTHNPYFEEVEPLYRDFGVDVKFLHCLREPIQALGSWYSHWWETCTGPDPRGAPPQLELAGASIARAIDHAKPIFAQYAHHFPHDGQTRDVIARAIENTRGVGLEDLHRQPRAALEKVRAWLGIDWHDALLSSTFDGQPWHYRTTGGKTVKGFQQTTITKKHADVFTPFDRLRLKLLFADQFQAWDYLIPRVLSWRLLAFLAAILWLLPLRMESSIWRAQSWRGLRTLGAIFSSYVVVRLKIFSRWWPDLKRRPPLIRLSINRIRLARYADPVFSR